MPGYQAGGPIRSIFNLVNLLKDDYDITIVTSNRDLNSSTNYVGMNKNIQDPLKCNRNFLNFNIASQKEIKDFKIILYEKKLKD